MKTIKIKCKGADLLPYDSLIQFQGDLKTISNKNLKKLKTAIVKTGFRFPFYIWVNDEQNKIINGHQRDKALKSLKDDGYEIPLLPVVYIYADNEQDAKTAILENSSQYGEWNESELNNWLDNIDSEIKDTLRFVDKEINIILKEETSGDDEIPEVAEPITKLGDLWELGRHRVLCGDSTKVEDVEKLMNGEKADMVFTDPPYGMNLDTDYSKIKGSTKSIGFKGNKLGNKYNAIIGDGEDFKPELITTILDNFKYCNEMFIFGADYIIDLLPNYGKEGCLLVWNKRSSDAQQKGIGNTFELFWSKKKHKKYVFNFEWFGFLSKEAPREARKRVHPSMKPIGLIERIFQWFNSPHGTVVDLYIGSGSTLIACEKTERTCYGMELDPHYCDVTVNRYKRWCKENNTKTTIKLNGKPWT